VDTETNEERDLEYAVAQYSEQSWIWESGKLSKDPQRLMGRGNTSTGSCHRPMFGFS
jgi:hypothetical protein